MPPTHEGVARFPASRKTAEGSDGGTSRLAISISIFCFGWTGKYKSMLWYVPALTTIPWVRVSYSFSCRSGCVRLAFITVMQILTVCVNQSCLVDTYCMCSMSTFTAQLSGLTQDSSPTAFLAHTPLPPPSGLERHPNRYFLTFS